MDKKQVGKRYGRALIHSTDTAQVPRVLDDLRLFSKLVDGEVKLRVLFESKMFSEQEKSAALEALLSYLKVSGTPSKILKSVIMRGHLPSLKEIIESSEAAYNEITKKMTATVTSPVELDEKRLGRMKESISELMRREVEIENVVDPSLIGGFIVQAGSTIFDSSLKGQIRLLRSELIGWELGVRD